VTIWGVERFVAELRDLGYEPSVEDGRVSVAWTIPLGSHMGQDGFIGWEVPADWPETSPHGPHIFPAFDHPNGGNHASAFGDGWRHWSRPFNGWAGSDRTMLTYLRFITAVFRGS
jgi:hypothetical protein